MSKPTNPQPIQGDEVGNEPPTWEELKARHEGLISRLEELLPKAICPECGGECILSAYSFEQKCSPEPGDTITIKSEYFVCLNDECEAIIWENTLEWDLALELGRKEKESK